MSLKTVEVTSNYNDTIYKLEMAYRWAVHQAKQMEIEARISRTSNPGRSQYMALKAGQFKDRAKQVNKKIDELVVSHHKQQTVAYKLVNLVKKYFFAK